MTRIRSERERLDQAFERAAGKTHSGKSDSGHTQVRISGNYEVEQIKIDHEALGLDQQTARLLRAEISQALNAALARARRRAEKAVGILAAGAEQEED